MMMISVIWEVWEHLVDTPITHTDTHEPGNPETGGVEKDDEEGRMMISEQGSKERVVLFD